MNSIQPLVPVNRIATGKSAAIVFVPYVPNLQTLPLAPACIKSALINVGIEQVSLIDANLRWQHYLDTLSPQVNQELFNFSHTMACRRLSSAAAESYHRWVSSVVAAVVANKPDYILVSMFSYLGQKFTEDICFGIREQYPEGRIIIGGQGANTFLSDQKRSWSEYATAGGFADCVCIGDVDLVLSKALHTDKKILHADQQTNAQLTASPVPDASVYHPLTQYGEPNELTLPITFSKGCIKKCVFCDVAAQWPKFRFASGNATADKIILLANTHTISKFYFTDNLVNGSCKELRALCDSLIASNKRVELSGNFIFRSRTEMPEDDFAAMAQAGFKKVIIGLESGSPKVRDDMKKGFSHQAFEYTTEQLFKNGIKQSWNIFVGFPTETEDDFAQTIMTITYYADKFKGRLEVTPIGIFQTIAGSPVREKNLFDLQQAYDGSYIDIQWLCPSNPSNTLEARILRWERLLDLLYKLGICTRSREKTANLTNLYKQCLK